MGCLLNPSVWGKGYMAEAINLLTTVARDVLRLRRLTADVASGNERAQRLFKQLGYERDDSGMLEVDLR